MNRVWIYIYGIMCKFRFFLVSFLFLTCTLFSQNNKVFIKSEKVLYKSTDQGDLNLYFYRPLNFDSSKTYNCIIFFHGGAWNNGNYKQFERQAMYFASRGMIAISAEYRIKSKHGTTPFESIEDAKSAIRFVRKNSKSYSINNQRIAAAGGSAGGHTRVEACLEDSSTSERVSRRPGAGGTSPSRRLASRSPASVHRPTAVWRTNTFVLGPGARSLCFNWRARTHALPPTDRPREVS